MNIQFRGECVIVHDVSIASRVILIISHFTFTRREPRFPANSDPVSPALLSCFMLSLVEYLRALVPLTARQKPFTRALPSLSSSSSLSSSWSPSSVGRSVGRTDGLGSRQRDARVFPRHARTNLTLLHTVEAINRVLTPRAPFRRFKARECALDGRRWHVPLIAANRSRARVSSSRHSSWSGEAVVTTRWTNEITSRHGTSNTITRHYLRAYVRPRLNSYVNNFFLISGRLCELR